jgi:hypothetical protein
MINQKEVEKLADLLMSVSMPNQIAIDKKLFKVKKGHEKAINNQMGTLQSDNFLGKSHEYTIFQGETEVTSISIQLYLNDKNYFRLFCFNPKGMMFSINFSRYYVSNHITVLKQDALIKNKSMSKEERIDNKNKVLNLWYRAGLKIDDDKFVDLGKYDIQSNKFIGTTPQEFLENYVIAALIKGNFMGNKEYDILG